MKKLLLAISLLAFAACKKQPAPSGPKLGAPDAGGYTRELVPAAATVTASSGPVKISLSMPTTSYRAIDGSIWVRFTVENIGELPFLVYGDALVLGAESLLKAGALMKLEVLDSDGDRAYFSPPEDHYPPVECWPEAYLLDFAERVNKYAFTLGPGKSTSTASYSYQPRFEAWCEKKPPPTQRVGFAEIRGFQFKPGVHTVRSSYNRTPPKGSRNIGNPDAVRVATPWLRFEVLP